MLFLRFQSVFMNLIKYHFCGQHTMRRWHQKKTCLMVALRSQLSEFFSQVSIFTKYNNATSEIITPNCAGALLFHASKFTRSSQYLQLDKRENQCVFMGDCCYFAVCTKLHTTISPKEVSKPSKM